MASANYTEIIQNYVGKIEQSTQPTIITRHKRYKTPKRHNKELSKNHIDMAVFINRIAKAM